jgi:myo-inositol-1(or 4)-monophosphatase
MNDVMLAHYLLTAKKAAHQAGNILKEHSANYLKVNFESASDVKLQADLESEALIREILHQESGLPIIGEEQGGDSNLIHSDRYYWVIDPLDGTYNYLRDMPFTCVSIGLMQGLKPILGVIYDFNLNETYAASSGNGLYINEKKITPNWAAHAKQACLATGFPAGRSYSTEALNLFVSRVQRFKKIRMIGSAALALAFVASSRCDIYLEESIRLWDIAAGLALIEAAGGHVQIQLVNAEQLKFNICAAGKQEWLLLDPA